MTEMGPGRFAHGSGALWLEEAKALLVADAHLGYGWAQRRRGELGPLRDDVVKEKLLRVVEALGPEEVVLVGDIVHAPKPCEPERRLIEETLEAVRRVARLTVVLGNHDRAFWRDFHVPAVEAWRTEGVVAVHGHEPVEASRAHVVMGHFHPAWSVVDNAGARRRVPVFAVTDAVTILPAFSPYAAGFDLRKRWPAELKAVLGEARPELWAAAGTRVVKVRGGARRA